MDCAAFAMDSDAAGAVTLSGSAAGCGAGSAGFEEGIRGASAILGTDPSISGSIDWISLSIGRSLRSPTITFCAGMEDSTTTWGTTGGSATGSGRGSRAGTTTGSLTGAVTGSLAGTAGDFSGSSEGITLEPQWLQKTDPGGTRFPHRVQNAPIGSDDVSTGFGGIVSGSVIVFTGITSGSVSMGITSGPVSTGIGLIPVFRGEVSVSMIVFIGRAASISFFTPGRVVISIRDGGCSVPFRRGSWSNEGTTLRIVLWIDDEVSSLSSFVHSSRSRFLPPPAVREKVSTSCRVSPELVMRESVIVWSRIAFSAATISPTVARRMSFCGMRFFFRSMRMMRLLVRIASKGIDLTNTS